MNSIDKNKVEKSVDVVLSLFNIMRGRPEGALAAPIDIVQIPLTRVRQDCDDVLVLAQL